MPKKILAVDDDQPNVILIQRNLERKGYQVITALNGEEALGKIADEHPDLVILDVMMPGMDGMEMLRQLRADSTTASLPVILLTGKVQDEDIFDGYQRGADLYLTKPYSLANLLAYVQQVFAENAAADAEEKVIEL